MRAGESGVYLLSALAHSHALSILSGHLLDLRADRLPGLLVRHVGLLQLKNVVIVVAVLDLVAETPGDVPLDPIKRILGELLLYHVIEEIRDFEHLLVLGRYLLELVRKFEIPEFYAGQPLDDLSYGAISSFKRALQVGFDLFVPLAYADAAGEVLKMHPLRPDVLLID
jgi:hypothetical protein